MLKSALAPLAAMLLTASAGPAAATDPVASPLAGATWQVVALDGQSVEPPPSDGAPRVASFTFGYRTYGGNAGCNAMGGLYAQIDERFYTMPGPQTAMACGGARAAQEDAANAIFSASPTVVRDGDSAVLEGGGHRMELRRLTAADNADDPTAWQGQGVAGQSYVVHAVNGAHTDGKVLWGKSPPRLRFTDTVVTLRLDCPGMDEGVFVQGLDTVYIGLLEPACTRPGTRDAALVRILGADPRTVSGPNGELLLASRFGWAILWNERRDRPK
ncbi:MAG TPA: META domain-containing protein [Croceibacterium sp.]|nr:META domain-containing protein [Croceibacterium sp.]